MKTLTKIAILILVATLAVLTVLTLSSGKPQKHYCEWGDCMHLGEVMDQDKFKPKWGCKEYTDCYYGELTHFMQPTLTSQQVENYVMQGVK